MTFFLSTVVLAHDQTLTYAKVLFSISKIEVTIVIPKENISDIIKLKNEKEETSDSSFFIRYFNNHFEIFNDTEKCISEIRDMMFLPDVNSYSYVFEFANSNTLNNISLTYNLFFEISESHACIADFILEDQTSQTTFTKGNHAIKIPVADLLKKWGKQTEVKQDSVMAQTKKNIYLPKDTAILKQKKQVISGNVVNPKKNDTKIIVKNPETVFDSSKAVSQNNRIEPTVMLFENQNWWEQSRAFFLLGIKHILTGYDHLLFLLGLLLVTFKLTDVIKIVTSFTVAHSITLVLAALGIFVMPPRITESLIALSISYIAFENIFLIEKKIAPRVQRWSITFFFGLIHGFGFSSVLREIDLPKEGLVTALLSFNVGIEVGQLSIVMLLLPFLIYMRKIKWNEIIVKICSVIIGALGIFWFFERAFFT